MLTDVVIKPPVNLFNLNIAAAVSFFADTVYYTSETRQLLFHDNNIINLRILLEQLKLLSYNKLLCKEYKYGCLRSSNDCDMTIVYYHCGSAYLVSSNGCAMAFVSLAVLWTVCFAMCVHAYFGTDVAARRSTNAPRSPLWCVKSQAWSVLLLFVQSGRLCCTKY